MRKHSLGTTSKPKIDLEDVLYDVLVSPNVSDSNGEAANIVDALDSIGKALLFVGRAIVGHEIGCNIYLNNDQPCNCRRFGKK